MTLLRWHIRPLDFRPDRAYPNAPAPITAAHKGEALLIAKLRHGPDVTVIADIALREVVADFSRWVCTKRAGRVGVGSVEAVERHQRKRLQLRKEVRAANAKTTATECEWCHQIFQCLIKQPGRYCSRSCRDKWYHAERKRTRPIRRAVQGEWACACGNAVREIKAGRQATQCPRCYSAHKARAYALGKIARRVRQGEAA